MAEERIETLQANAGRNPGEAIASYGRSIVFLPAGVKPGETVRVRLQEIKPDSRGRMMYRAVPAPVEYSERWKDNGDGTTSRVTIATDWLGKTSEEGVVETRPLAVRERELRTDSRFAVRFGADLGSTIVEERKIKIVGQEREEVNIAGAIEWKIVGQREEPAAEVDMHAAVELSTGPSEWNLKKLEPVYDNGWEIEIQVRTEDSRWRQFRQPWGTLPQWLRYQEEGRRPVCACGRRRHEVQGDSYAKCELCRAEEFCERCGTQAKVVVINSHLVCTKCQPYAEQEELIARMLTAGHKSAIAAEAQKLLAGQAFGQAEGETILRATADHIASSWVRDDCLRRWAGYGWYYFGENGVYGSKLAPAALSVFEFLPRSSGNGLVEMMAWLAGGQKPSGSDFYLRTQVNGETGIVPVIAEDQLKQVVAKLEANQPVLADRLRGSEKDRMEALAGYRRIAEAFGEDSGEAKAVADILQGNEQDYAAACSKVREWQLLFAAAELGEVLINFGGHFRRMGQNDQLDFWAFGPDGAEIEPSETDFRRRYTSEGEKRWWVVGKNDLALSWERGQAGRRFFESWRVAKLPADGVTEAQREAVRAAEPHERFRGAGTGFDLTRVGTVTVSVSRDEREIPLREFRGMDCSTESSLIRCEVYGWSSDVVSEEETEDGWAWPEANPRLTELRGQLRNAEWRLDDLSRELGKCEGENPSRVLLTFELDSERKTLFAVTAVRPISVEVARSGEWTTISGLVRFVCDPARCSWLDIPPAAGETWACSWKRMIGRDKKGRPIVVANPQSLVDEKARAVVSAEVAKIKAEIERLRLCNSASDESACDPSDHRTVTPEMLEALKAKWTAK